MNEQTKTEVDTTTGDTTKTAGQGDPKDPMKQVWDFFNNPLVANSALGIALYKLIDPNTVKNYLQNLQRQQNAMAKAMNEQSEMIKVLHKEVRMLTELIGGGTVNGRYEKQADTKRNWLKPGAATLD